MIYFDGDGTATLGLDSTGKKTGYTADVWFGGTQLSISFRDFDGESAVCPTAVGLYEVQKLENGSIRFVTLNDSCEVRSNILSGQPDLGFDLVFQPVDIARTKPF